MLRRERSGWSGAAWVRCDGAPATYFLPCSYVDPSLAPLSIETALVNAVSHENSPRTDLLIKDARGYGM